MTSGMVLWGVAVMLFLWQTALTFLVMKSKEEGEGETHRLGTAAYALSQVVERFDAATWERLSQMEAASQHELYEEPLPAPEVPQAPSYAGHYYSYQAPPPAPVALSEDPGCPYYAAAVANGWAPAPQPAPAPSVQPGHQAQRMAEMAAQAAPTPLRAMPSPPPPASPPTSAPTPAPARAQVNGPPVSMTHWGRPVAVPGGPPRSGRPSRPRRH